MISRILKKHNLFIYTSWEAESYRIDEVQTGGGKSAEFSGETCRMERANKVFQKLKEPFQIDDDRICKPTNGQSVGRLLDLWGVARRFSVSGF